jgi:hypothetical protein
VLVSAGPKDADGDGNVFDDVTTGTHQGDNRDGNPNYIRYPPNNAFDDMLVYLGGYVLYGEICGTCNLTVSNGTAGTTIFVHNVTQNLDIGIVIPGDIKSYGIISGSQIELRDAADGLGSIVASTPITPPFVAGSGVTLVVP